VLRHPCSTPRDRPATARGTLPTVRYVRSASGFGVPQLDALRRVATQNLPSGVSERRSELVPCPRDAKPRDALVVGPPSRPLGRQGKRGVMAGTDPTRRSSRSASSRAARGGPELGAAMLSRGPCFTPPTDAQTFGTARRIAFPSFTNTRYSTSRALCRSSSSGTCRLRLATTASNDSRVVSSLQRRFAST